MTLPFTYICVLDQHCDNANFLTILLTNNFYIIWPIIILIYISLPQQFTLILCICWINTHNSLFITPVGLQNRIFLIHPLILFYVIYILLRSFIFLQNSNYLVVTTSLSSNIKFLCMGLCSFTLFLGGFWAQQEFNWGGWWSWDSVEMSSVLLWLFILYYIHTPAKLLRNLWCLRLLYLYFLGLLTIIWFMNRSNLFSSIHAFTSSYTYLYLFLYLCAGISVYMFSSYIYYIPHFKYFWKSIRNLIFVFTAHWCWLFFMDYNVTHFKIYYWLLFVFFYYTFVLQKVLIVSTNTLKFSVDLIHLLYITLFMFLLISYNLNHNVYLFTHNNIGGLINFSFLYKSFYTHNLFLNLTLSYFMFQSFTFFKPIIFFTFNNAMVWVYKQTTLGIVSSYLYYWLWL